MENNKNNLKNTLNQEKVNYKMLILFIGFALAAGFLGSLLGGNMTSFKNTTLKGSSYEEVTSQPVVIAPINDEMILNGYIIITYFSNFIVF